MTERSKGAFSGETPTGRSDVVRVRAPGYKFDITIETDAHRLDFLDRALLGTLAELEERGEAARVADIVRELGGLGAPTSGPVPLTPRLVEDLLVQLLRSGAILLVRSGSDGELYVRRDPTARGERRARPKRSRFSYWQDAATGTVVRYSDVGHLVSRKGSPPDEGEVREIVLAGPGKRQRRWRWLAEMSEAEALATVEPLEAGREQWERPHVIGIERKPDEFVDLLVPMRVRADGKALPSEVGVPRILARMWARLPAGPAMDLGESRRDLVKPWSWLKDTWLDAVTEALDGVSEQLDAEERRQRSRTRTTTQSAPAEPWTVRARTETLRLVLRCDVRVSVGRPEAEALEEVIERLRQVLVITGRDESRHEVARLLDVRRPLKSAVLGPDVGRAARRWRADAWSVEDGPRRDLELTVLDNRLFVLGGVTEASSLWIVSDEPIHGLTGHYSRGERASAAPRQRGGALAERVGEIHETTLQVEREVRAASQAKPDVRAEMLANLRPRVESTRALLTSLRRDLAGLVFAAWETVDAGEVPDILAAEKRLRRVVVRSEKSPVAAAARRNPRAKDVEVIVWAREAPGAGLWLDGGGPGEVALFDDLVLLGQWRDPEDAGVPPFFAVSDPSFAATLRAVTDRARRVGTP